MVQAYRERSQDVANNVEKITQAINAMSDYFRARGRVAAHGRGGSRGGPGAPLRSHLRRIWARRRNFPSSFAFSLLLRALDIGADPAYAEIVDRTLTHMAKGGSTTRSAAGFIATAWTSNGWCRISKRCSTTTPCWRGFILTRRARWTAGEFLQTAREIFDYVMREMTSPEGGFYSTQDADSEGEEGKFFVWTVAEVREVLGPDLAPIAERYFDVTAEGNFEGKNILHRTIDIRRRGDAVPPFAPQEMERRHRGNQPQAVRGRASGGSNRRATRRSSRPGTA